MSEEEKKPKSKRLAYIIFTVIIAILLIVLGIYYIMSGLEKL